jgi:hypothetical protein
VGAMGVCRGFPGDHKNRCRFHNYKSLSAAGLKRQARPVFTLQTSHKQLERTQLWGRVHRLMRPHLRWYPLLPQAMRSPVRPKALLGRRKNRILGA